MKQWQPKNSQHNGCALGYAQSPTPGVQARLPMAVSAGKSAVVTADMLWSWNRPPMTARLGKLTDVKACMGHLGQFMTPHVAAIGQGVSGFVERERESFPVR